MSQERWSTIGGAVGHVICSPWSVIMRRALYLVALLGLFGANAWAEDSTHAEMAAALAAQADVYPTPPVLPVAAAPPRAATARKRDLRPATDAARTAADQSARRAQVQGASQAAAHQAQAAAAAAAGQAQAKAAKERAAHPHPH
jgi:hypothetical protein